MVQAMEVMIMDMIMVSLKVKILIQLLTITIIKVSRILKLSKKGIIKVTTNMIIKVWINIIMESLIIIILMQSVMSRITYMTPYMITNMSALKNKLKIRTNKIQILIFLLLSFNQSDKIILLILYWKIKSFRIKIVVMNPHLILLI